jgi:hypothetical protein
MSDWTWEYVPDAPSIVGGLTQAQVDEVEPRVPDRRRRSGAQDRHLIRRP